MTDTQSELLAALARFQEWERDVRDTFAKYRMLRQCVPPAELARLYAAIPTKPRQ
jgi:hypothetical protein